MSEARSEPDPRSNNPLTQLERACLDGVIVDVSSNRRVEAIFYIANGLYDLGMEMVVEEEL